MASRPFRSLFEFGQYLWDGAEGAVDMEPELFGPGDFSECGQVIDRAGVDRSGVAYDAEREDVLLPGLPGSFAVCRSILIP